jgi:hypothetical protein
MILMINPIEAIAMPLVAYMAGLSQHGMAYAPIEYMPDGTRHQDIP